MILYRALLGLLAAGVLLRAALARDREALARRLGHGPAARAPHLWLHAASNGELASARPVIEAWRAARPDLPLVVTCNTASGVQLARGWGLAAELAPLDLAGAVRRFCARWRVAGHIAMESEIWPNRIAMVPGPVVVLGARMSARSAGLWARFPGLARATLGRISFASAQDEASLERLCTLGLPAGAAGPVIDLKALYTPPPGQVPSADLSAAFPRETTWLAASIHEEDEAIVLEAHRRALAARPDLRLILAPRHPRRGDALADAAADLHVARRSAHEAPGTAPVLLADTLGEMPLWYALAGIVFVGGTFGSRGGHTPYEPAHFGAALIHGPDVSNFRAPYAALARAGAATEVRDAHGLAGALVALTEPKRRAAQGAAARAALRPEAGLDALTARLGTLFPASPVDCANAPPAASQSPVGITDC